MSAPPRPKPALGDPLTARDVRILDLLAHGHTVGQIARRLWIGHGTVKGDLVRIYAKLGARDRAHAIGIAYQRGILTPDQTAGGETP